MPKVLIIEDDIVIQELISFNLKREGFEVLLAADGLTGLDTARSANPDIIILDLMLPVLDGYEVCKALRSNHRTTRMPIIILSARNEVTDKVIGLELGADDYMIKPFSPKELIARIRARLREHQRISSSIEPKTKLAFGDLEIWPGDYVATLAGKPLTLTVKEFEILEIFLSHPNQIFSREHLLQKVWGYDNAWDTRTVDVHVSNLRQKLQGMGKSITTVRGIGYRFSL